MKITKKKAAIQELMPLVISLVAIGITLAIGLLILSEVAANKTVAADYNASNAVAETVSAIADIPGWLPIIVITVIGALLLGLVYLFTGRPR